MSSYEEKEKVRSLPCTHEFHQECIDQWFKVRICLPSIIGLGSSEAQCLVCDLYLICTLLEYLVLCGCIRIVYTATPPYPSPIRL